MQTRATSAEPAGHGLEVPRGGDGFLATSTGVRLRYVDRGEGPPIVLVHGWKGSHRVWDGTIDRLAERFRVVAFDLRGMGESDKPASRYDFDELADDLGEVLAALDLVDVTLVAWSMACTVTLQYLRRGGGRIGRLVLMNGPMRLRRGPDFPWGLTDERIEQLVTDIEEHWPQREREFIPGYFREPRPEQVDWLYEIALQTPKAVALATIKAQAALDFSDFLPSISVPTLALYGGHDRAWPPELADVIAERVPNGERVIFEDSAHLPFVEEPERFEAVISRFATGGSA